MANKKQEAVEKVKKVIKDQATKHISISEKDQEAIKECFKQAELPVDFTDEDFKLGAQELDIRNLSQKNLNQIFFRLLSVNVSLQRQLAQIMIDIERLVMLSLTTKGMKATDISVELAKMINDLAKDTEKYKA